MDAEFLEFVGEEVVSIEEVKQHLRIDHNLDDGYLTTLIQAATEYCENATNRIMRPKRMALYLERFPSKQSLELAVHPVQSIMSVNYWNEAGEESLLPASAYEAKLTIEPAALLAKAGWPQVPPQPGRVRIEVTAGFQSVPPSIRQAILLICGHFYENREIIGDKYGNQQELPLSVTALLSPYKRYRW